MYTNSFSLLTLAFLSVGFLQTAHSAEPPKGFVACDFTGSGIAADVELSDLSGSVEPVIVYSSSVQPKTLAQAKATLPAVVEIPNPVPIQIATTIVDTHRVVEAPATEQPVKPITVQVALVEAPQKEQRKSEPTMRLEWSRKSIQDIVLPNVELSEQVNSFDGATEATVQLVTRKMNRLSVQ